jgi:hypothetical protein
VTPTGWRARRLGPGEPGHPGWTRFKFRNPATGKVEPKKAYTERVGDVLVGSGAYTTD